MQKIPWNPSQNTEPLPARTENSEKSGKTQKNGKPKKRKTKKTGKLGKTSFCLVEINIFSDYCDPEVERNRIF